MTPSVPSLYRIIESKCLLCCSAFHTPAVDWQQPAGSAWEQQQAANSWQYQQQTAGAWQQQAYDPQSGYDNHWQQAQEQPNTSWPPLPDTAQADWQYNQAWAPPAEAPVSASPVPQPQPSLEPPLPRPSAAPVPSAASVAYTSVAPRPPQTPKPATAWPEALRKYVERAFAQPVADKGLLQKELTQIINTAQTRGDLWTKDWDNFALPLEAPAAADQPGRSVAFSINSGVKLRTGLDTAAK